MIICDDVICKRCRKVFCCTKCRERHVVKSHGGIETENAYIEEIKAISPDCSICEGQPLILHSEVTNETLLHIANVHLPLNCKKCSKIYTSLDDFAEFSTCSMQQKSCRLQITEMQTDISANMTKATTVSTQTSPLPKTDLDETPSNLTPISMINLRWKAKSKISEGFISDSVSSIRNISSINNSSIRRTELTSSAKGKGKLVRSTSTPLQGEIISKPKEQVFYASSGHVSSIYNSGNESDVSPPVINSHHPITPSNQVMENARKIRSRARVPVTPLRHVMSKSIQKAIAEHGMIRSPIGYRKKILDSIDSSASLGGNGSAVTSPLDLRSSPVLRRTQSEFIESKSSNLRPDASSLKTSTSRRSGIFTKTESILITSTKTSSSASANSTMQDSQKSKNFNSVFQTCHSVEIITETELSEVNYEPADFVAGTPRSGGAPITKKIINFETPNFADSRELNTTVDEVFFTPNSTPVKSTSRLDKSLVQRSKGLTYNQAESYSREQNEDIQTVENDEVFTGPNEKTQKSRGRLWSLVSAVMRLPSLSKFNEKEKPAAAIEKEEPTSLIKRCASFAGAFIHSNPEENDNQSLKRKRTYTDASSLYLSQLNQSAADPDSSVASKRLRIQGRKPIERMRRNKN